MASAVEVGPAWDRLKELDLVDVFVSDVGPIQRKGTKWAFFNCPVHGDKNTPSLAVNLRENTWFCFGSCKTGGDIYHWYKHRHGLSNTETYQLLTGEQVCNRAMDADLTAAPVEAGTWEAPDGASQEKEYKTWTVEELVRRTRRKGLEHAERYFMARGITRETVNDPRFLLGTEDWNWTPSVGNAWKWDGEPIKRHNLTIPNIFGDTVLSVKCRRDDRRSREALENGEVPDKLFFAALEALHDLKGAENVTESLILDTLFGNRFLSWSGGNGAVPYNQRMVADWRDGLVVPRERDYIMITEAEIDTMYLRDALGAIGYPAIALHKTSTVDLKRLLARVERVFIVKDVDQNDAGTGLAHDVLEALGRGRVIAPPVGKDANDVPVDQIMPWLAKFNIVPLPRMWL